MNYKYHILSAFIFFAIIYILDVFYLHFFNFDLKMVILFAPLLAFMALAPDSDHRQSMPRLILTIFAIIGILWFVWFDEKIKAIIIGALLLIMWILPFFPGWGHRGHFHSLIIVTIFSIPLWYLGGLNLFILGWFFGFSHLLADNEISIWK